VDKNQCGLELFRLILCHIIDLGNEIMEISGIYLKLTSKADLNH